LILLAPSLLLPILTGLAIANFRPCRHGWLRGVLGTAVGIGLASLCYFLSLATGIQELVIEGLLLIGAGGWWVWRRKDPCLHCTAKDRPAGGYERLLMTAFLLVLAGAAAVLVAESAHTPHGNWDAWAIYNLRARFLYRAGPNWRDAFSPLLLWSHPDYPLLVPAFVARTWKHIGQDSTWVPALTALMFTLGAPVVLAAVVSILRGREQGWLAGLFLLGTPFFIMHGAAQYADVEVAFFVLATVSLLALHDDRPAEREFAVLAGLCAGLAAWSKNEGLLFIAVVVAARVAALLLTRQGSQLKHELPMFAAGLAPILAAVLYFRQTLATTNYFLAASVGGGPVTRALDFSRYVIVAKGFLVHLWTFGDLYVSPFLLLGVFVLLVKPDAGARRSSAFTSLFAVILMLAGYSMVYVGTQGDLAWILNTSLDRLLLQIWPLSILSAFLAVRRAEA
jgi:hypothetical protein